MINIAICDDNKIIVDMIRKCVSDYMREETTIHKFYNGEDILNASMTIKFDIIFMDIKLSREEQIKGLDNGINVSARIKATQPLAALIFISDYTSYFGEMVHVEPLGFISKPFNREDIIEMLKKAIIRKATIDNSNISVKYYGINVRINLSEIKYFYSQLRKIYIHKDELNQDDFSFYDKLNNVEDKMRIEYPNFVRVNHSYLVNKAFITDYKDNNVYVGSSNIVIPIGRKYIEHVRRSL